MGSYDPAAAADDDDDDDDHDDDDDDDDGKHLFLRCYTSITAHILTVDHKLHWNQRERSARNQWSKWCFYKLFLTEWRFCVDFLCCPIHLKRT